MKQKLTYNFHLPEAVSEDDFVKHLINVLVEANAWKLNDAIHGEKSA